MVRPTPNTRKKEREMTTIFEKEWKPSYPYVTNNFAHGLHRTKREKGLDYKWVQTAPKKAVNLLTFDLDDGEAERKIKTLAWDDELIPEPSWATFNPASGHAHVAYFLADPVGSPKGLEYAKDVRGRLNALLGGDSAYSGFTTRNPLHAPTLWMSDHLYTLKELDSFAKKNPLKVKPVSIEGLGGRNDFMFESLRKYAYGSYRRLGWNQAALLVDLEKKGLEFYYSQIEDYAGFPPSEVASITRSVHKWVVKNHSKEAFSEIQRQRQLKRWAPGREKREDRLVLIEMLKEMGFTWKEIGENLQIDPESARKAWQRAKKLNPSLGI